MDVTGSSQKKKLFLFNGLKRSVDVLGNPWIDGVERAKGIEPISVMCQFVPNLLNTVSLLPSPSLFVSVWHIGFDDFSTHYPSLNHVRRSSID